MPDLKPPHLVAEELDTLHALLQFQRESLVRKVTGIDDDEARRSPVSSGTTLLWLVKHAAFAESIWMEHRFLGAGPPLDNEVRPDDTLAGAVEAYRAMWARTDAIVADAGLDATCADLPADDQVNIRWILMHLLEETARHAGHADILRELVDGDTGR